MSGRKRVKIDPGEPLFPGVVDRAKPPEEDEGKWKREFWKRYGELTSRMGKNETYNQRTRDLILARIVPEWIFRGALLSQNPDHVDRCQKAVIALERLHAEIFGKDGLPW